MAMLTSVIWIEGLVTLKLHHKLFFYNLHSFVLKHILHVIVLMTIYDLVSNVTTYVTRIPHMSLCFNVLSGNLKNYMNRVFLSFDYTIFNIMNCLVTICIVHSYYLCNCKRFMS
jgi:hypothetical protein